MNTLENIGNLVERLAGKIEGAVDEREAMLLEIAALRERLIRRDKEAVQAAHDMRAELEAARADVLCLSRERAGIDKIFENLRDVNERLISLANKRDS